ncbi:27694_t:CDS:1 [Dentiscutata erythropus]|uniref:27694_t:CDS:1 n=1 Tax=Dentiscutata erythropus TaxID=1348616 RepID=A0A9N9HK91_9GLOM|nr:27694_t:CDS:1 [Dentiscutata erythropus]
MSDFSQLVHKLSEPIPQYVLGCLPAIAIVGASPENLFTKKLIWVLRCLGCPFMGIFYSVNIGGNQIHRYLFWLPVNNFEDNAGRLIPYRPVGVYTMRLSGGQDIDDYINRCTAKVSVLERLSSLIPVYYIIVGVLAGISRATGSIACEDWPYIPLLLSWTIPALWRRISSGNLVVKDPKVEFGDRRITMVVNPDDRSHKSFTVFLTAFLSVTFPWITLLLAYYTPPIGYFCRSKYITVICSVWSFNNVLAYLCHLKGEKDLTQPSILHTWYSFCGFIVAILLLVMGLFDKNPSWWVGLFGQSCDVSSAGC